MSTTTTLRTYQVKRAWAINPTTGRATRTQIGWTLTRDGEALDLFRTRQQARDAKAAAIKADALAAARAQRQARMQALLTVLASFVAFVVVVVLGLPSQPLAMASPTAAPLPAVEVVRALALPADVAFRALFTQ